MNKIETKTCEYTHETMYKCPDCGEWDYDDISHLKQCRVCYELENHPENLCLTHEESEEMNECSKYIMKHNISPNLDSPDV